MATVAYGKVLALGLMTMACGPSAAGQLVIRLQPATVAAFEQYAAGVEISLSARSQGKKPFIQAQENAAGLKQVLAGEYLVRSESEAPIDVTGGLIHDWVGTVYFANTSIERVVNLLEDFNRHKNIYPQIADSRTLHRSANDVAGYWRLQQKGLIPVSFNVDQDAHYEEISPGKWIGRSYARRIAEINSNLFARGREYPTGEGHGYLWRLYSYWSLDAWKGGVLAECRTLSLSRDIPEGLSWAVTPFIQKMPQDSLTSTLRATREALAASKGKR